MMNLGVDYWTFIECHKFDFVSNKQNNNKRKTNLGHITDDKLVYTTNLILMVAILNENPHSYCILDSVHNISFSWNLNLVGGHDEVLSLQSQRNCHNGRNKEYTILIPILNDSRLFPEKWMDFLFRPIF